MSTRDQGWAAATALALAAALIAGCAVERDGAGRIVRRRRGDGVRSGLRAPRRPRVTDDPRRCPGNGR